LNASRPVGPSKRSLFGRAPSPSVSSFKTTLICDALAVVNRSEWVAFRAPRKPPGVQPWALRILCPKPSVDRDQEVLLGSCEILVFLHILVSDSSQWHYFENLLARRRQAHLR
jgi:hypothetical protein